MQNNDYENRTELYQGLFGQTDRENGEYYFKSGETQHIYSNAHYSPAGEQPQPTKYYKPERSSPKAKHSKSKSNSGLVYVLVLCISCALLGGIIGAVVTTGLFSKRVNNIENMLSVSTSAPSVISNTVVSSDAEISKANYSVSASDVFSLACKEVVSITTEYSVVQPNGKIMPGKVTGSGFIISSDGYIVTNYHVVEKAYNGGYPVNVSLYDGTMYDGQIVGFDDINDIAIVKINASNLEAVEIGSASDIIGGADITIAGYPYGMFSVNSGHISNPSVDIDVDDNGNVLKMFQMDVSVYEGNSGGPVYNGKGQVIGIVTAKVSVNASEGIGFALPVSLLDSVFNQISTTGSISDKASMDIGFYKEYDDLFQLYWSLPEGAFVESVVPGGAAASCGLTTGDVIAQIGDYPVHDYNDVNSVLSHYHSMDQAQVYFYREGALMTTTITFSKA